MIAFRSARWSLQLVACLAFGALGAPAESAAWAADPIGPASSRPDPTREALRPEPPGVGRQILGGSLYGAGGLLAGGAVGAGLLSWTCFQWGEDCGFAGLGGALIGGAFGFAGAFPYGAYRFGSDDHFSGSLAWTYAGALLGSAAGFGGWALASGLEDQDHWFQASLLGIAGAPIGALIGLNLTRAPRGAGLPRADLAPLPGGGWAGRLTWSLR